MNNDAEGGNSRLIENTSSEDAEGGGRRGWWTPWLCGGGKKMWRWSQNLAMVQTYDGDLRM